MLFSLPLFGRRKTNSPPTFQVPEVKRLAAAYGDPYECSSTRTGVSPWTIGGSAYSMGVLEPRATSRWKRTIATPARVLQNDLIVTATAWEKSAGEGSITWDMRPQAKPSTRSPVRLRYYLAKSVTFTTGYAHSAQNDNFLRTTNVALVPGLSSSPRQGFTGMRPHAGSARAKRRRSFVAANPMRRKRAVPQQSFRVELKRDLKFDTWAMHRENIKHGKFNLILTPRKRLVSSIVIKEALWKEIWKSRRRPRRKHRSYRKEGYRKQNAKVVIKSDAEYRWKENCFSFTGSVEAFNGSVGLTTRTNPMRFTPRVLVPLGKTKGSPHVGWVGEPGSGPGELQLGRKGFEVSTSWPLLSRIGVKQRSSDGSMTRVHVNKTGVFVIDKTFVSRPIYGSAIATISAHLTNAKAGSTLNASLQGPFGVLSAMLSSSRSLNLLINLDINRGNQTYAVGIKVEEAKRVAARLGFYL